MSDEESPAPVFWGNNNNKEPAIHPPRIDLLGFLSTCLHAIGDQQRDGIKHVAEEFGIDPQSQRQRQKDMRAAGKISDAKIDEKDAEIDEKINARDLYTINKALALELVMSLMMYRLDSPVSCRANCELRYGWPRCYAPRGVPDVMVDYGNGCIVNVEVSAKKDMNKRYFKKQLTGSLKHMEETQATWTLLVTGWGLENASARKCYEDFCRENKNKLKARKLLVMSVESLARVGTALASDLEFQSGKKFISSKDMVEIFKALEEATASGRQGLELETLWFHEAQKRMQEAPPSPEPDPEPDPEPGPGPGPGM